MNRYLWIITIYNYDTEPIVTAFDNEDAAREMYSYLVHLICGQNSENNGSYYDQIVMNKVRVPSHYRILEGESKEQDYE